MTRATTATTAAPTADAPEITQGGVAFVGTGPGDPELLTVRAVQLIRAADVIITEAPEHRTLVATLREDVSLDPEVETEDGP